MISSVEKHMISQMNPKFSIHKLDPVLGCNLLRPPKREEIEVLGDYAEDILYIRSFMSDYLGGENIGSVDFTDAQCLEVVRDLFLEEGPSDRNLVEVTRDYVIDTDNHKILFDHWDAARASWLKSWCRIWFNSLTERVFYPAKEDFSLYFRARGSIDDLPIMCFKYLITRWATISKRKETGWLINSLLKDHKVIEDLLRGRFILSPVDYGHLTTTDKVYYEFWKRLGLLE